MKKYLFYSMVVAIALCATACNKNKSDVEDKSQDSNPYPYLRISDVEIYYLSVSVTRKGSADFYVQEIGYNIRVRLVSAFLIGVGLPWRLRVIAALLPLDFRAITVRLPLLKAQK